MATYEPTVTVKRPITDLMSLERVRYFPGQLLIADDMYDEQCYFRERMRRHNRMLHGWGVVCGAQVRNTNCPWTVEITQGFILDPQGNEIWIEKDTMVDLRAQAPVDPCTNQADPWCSDVVTLRVPSELYLAVCYDECLTKPVRVHLRSCGCDATECEYSRIRESFRFRVTTQVPPGAACDEENNQAIRCPAECPLPEAPCVWLAKISLDNTSGKATTCPDFKRRMVYSLAYMWMCCQNEQVQGPTSHVLLARQEQVIAPEGAPSAGQALRIVLPEGRSSMVTLPADVQASSVRELIDQIGDAPMVMNGIDHPIRIRDIIAATDIPLEEQFPNREALFQRLESAPIDIQGYLNTRAVLSNLVTPDALAKVDERDGGRLGDLAARTKATLVAGVEPRSPVSRALGQSSIQEIAEMPVADLLGRVRAPAREKSKIADDLQLIKTRAERIVHLASTGRR